jgi:hypothetical protein
MERQRNHFDLLQKKWKQTDRSIAKKYLGRKLLLVFWNMAWVSLMKVVKLFLLNVTEIVLDHLTGLEKQHIDESWNQG